jgi:hypothetical protein
VKICALLSWYDESVGWLANATASAGRFCDHIVAVDGAYSLYPGARPRSLPAQAEAVLQAAEVAGIGCTVHQPKDIYWGNEVEKRNLTLQLAGAVLEPEDWVVVIDADQYLMRINAESVRWDLEHTDKLVATYTVLEGRDHLSDERIAQLAKTTDLDTEWTSRVLCAYRWHPTLSYGPYHWTVSREDHYGQRVWLWGPNGRVELAEPLDLDRNLVFYHRTEDRALVRKVAAAAYYDTRDSFRVEKWDEEEALDDVI